MYGTPSYKPRRNKMNPALMNGGTPPVVAQLTVKMLADGTVSTSYNGPGRDALNVMIARVQ